jgi:hypothetical protein
MRRYKTVLLKHHLRSFENFIKLTFILVFLKLEPVELDLLDKRS